MGFAVAVLCVQPKVGHAENVCRNREALGVVDQTFMRSIGMHIAPQTAEISPYAGPENGKESTICRVLIVPASIIATYRITPSERGYATEVLAP